MSGEPLRVACLALPHADGLPPPSAQSEGAAGLDLMAAYPEGEERTIGIRERLLVPTGFALQLPPGYEAQVRPRSGLAVRHGITVLNSPGTIDADYRGEVMVLLVNHGAEPFTVRRGMRIAQLVVAPVSRVALAPVSSLDPSGRGGGGFGSTGS
jgi:dUTP pyrophosphatase